MSGKITALLVYDRARLMEDLKGTLERTGVSTLQAQTCAEAHRFLRSTDHPQLVFTDTELPDGTWAEIVRVAASSPIPAQVVVVSRLVDVQFYIETLEHGAFDFIAPPFEASGLEYIIRCATAHPSGHGGAPSYKATVAHTH